MKISSVLSGRASLFPAILGLTEFCSTFIFKLTLASTQFLRKDVKWFVNTRELCKTVLLSKFFPKVFGRFQNPHL